jgi:hypothetical protein
VTGVSSSVFSLQFCRGVSEPAGEDSSQQTDSQEAVVNTASEGTVCNRSIVIPTVKSGIKSVKD